VEGGQTSGELLKSKGIEPAQGGWLSGLFSMGGGGTGPRLRTKRGKTMVRPNQTRLAPGLRH